ncbi:MAG: SusC/RagA family TonB-linked outer membrane protein [Saprospiraceae bacterium]|nr:SusC/RagA family TonB-linked outer membrane protein [Saprospiraceae bacterium]MBL0109584.1 SusC/RagA family TonB-linked outer membrane protein [Saprospiraceae bacterium]
MMKLKRWMAVHFFMLFGLALFAQSRVITGTVLDAENQPIVGAAVAIKGTTDGTFTDLDGKFSINTSGNAVTLVVSSIGFGTTEVVVSPGQSNVEVRMDFTVLEEVVVTSLGISRVAKTLVYATQSVKPSTLTEVRDANNVINSLQGKIANAVITQASGGPGSGARIVLRGNRSIQGTNNALIVVDGVPITNGTNGTITSDFGGLQGTDGASNINADDIESMTVLRGASAAALYGSQAGNGVIVITTKKGSKDRLSVNINSGWTAERPFVLPALQNTYGQGNSGVLKGNSGESWGAKMDGQSFTGYNGEQRNYSAEPNNIKDFFRTGLSANNSIGISGGSEKMQTYLSYTNNSVQGIMPRNNLGRHNINLRISNTLSSKFSTDAKITYINQFIDSKYSTGEGGPVMELFQIPRNVSIADAQNYEVINNVGVPVPAPYPVINPALYQNPYWRVNRSENNEKRDRIMGFLSARYNITDWLHITGRANIDKTADQLEGIAYNGTLGNTGGGSYGTTNINVFQKWFDAILEGSNDLTKDIKIDYRGGAIYQDNAYSAVYNSASGLNVPNKFSLNFATNPSFSQGATQVQTQSLFAQANVGFKNFLFLDASVRNDWDSRLPAPYSFLYSSFGASAILSDIITFPKAFDFVKLSASYAEVGNGGQAQIRFNTFGYSQGAGNGFISRSGIQAIPDLKPEIVKNVEVGLEAKFVPKLLGVALTYYKSNSFNQLLRVSLPAATGFASQYINAGNIQNTGLELVLSATPIQKSNFNWNLEFNLASNKNKIIELTETVKEFAVSGSGFGRSATPVVRVGGSYGDMDGFVWRKDAQGRYLVTDAGLPLSTLTTGKNENIGNFNPKATLGLSNTFNIGKIALRILVDGRIGGVIMDGTEQLLAFNGAPEVTAQYREGGWNLGGVNEKGEAVNKTITAQQFWTTASGGRYGSAEFFTYDATNFRIRELTAGYTIPIAANKAIKGAKVSLVARNLLFLYRGSSILDIPGLAKRKMSFDPDMSLGNGNWQGVSYGTSPSTRSIGVNLNLTF